MKKTATKSTTAKSATSKASAAKSAAAAATRTVEPVAKSSIISTKPAETAAKSPVFAPKPAVPAAPKPAAPAPVKPLAEAPKPAAPAPAKKKAASLGESPATLISAKVDIGFGNHLYLRGSGPGLSWDRGIAMDCVAADIWTASLKEVKEPVSFKLLVNDSTWSTGNDFVVEPGQSITVNPVF